MKKFLALIMVAVMLFTLNISAFAGLSDDTCGYDPLVFSQRIIYISNSANQFLREINSENYLTKNYVKLFNFKGELEALFYKLSPQGYLVASYKNGEIIEYSPDNLPVNSLDTLYSKTLYYGSPLSFYEKASSNNSYKNIVTEEIIEVNDYDHCYSDDYVSDISSISLDSNQQDNSRFTLSAPINYVSATTSNGYYCTVTGITNLLQYYHDYYGADVYMGTVNSVSGLRSKLVSWYYIYNGKVNLGDSVNAYTLNGVTYYGLQSYLNRSDVTTYTASTSVITVNKVINYVQSHPILMGIYTKGISITADPEDTHVVLCYGYWQTYLFKGCSNDDQIQRSLTTYYIVNNGWGSNGVYVKSTYVGTGPQFRLLRLY